MKKGVCSILDTFVTGAIAVSLLMRYSRSCRLRMRKLKPEIAGSDRNNVPVLRLIRLDQEHVA